MRTTLIAVALLMAGAAEAQQPAELPPPGFSGRQYTDSTGCVFVHVDVGGVARWVALMTAERVPVCAAVEAVAEPAPRRKVVAVRPAVVASKSVSNVPRGYKLAWEDGRLNPNRGPRTAAGDAQMARLFDTSRVPMRPRAD
jgi:hypothetical protein